MELSIIAPAARVQGLPLWAMPLALFQNQVSKRLLDGTASSAPPAAGCEPVRSGFGVQRLPTRPEPSPPVPKRSASRPATVLDKAGLGVEFVPAGLFPAAISANPT